MAEQRNINIAWTEAIKLLTLLFAMDARTERKIIVLVGLPVP
jgi:hypothetical protein